MPEIIVSADSDKETPILMRERVSESALASEHYAAQLLQRIGWAVVDASEAEGISPDQEEELAASR